MKILFVDDEHIRRKIFLDRHSSDEVCTAETSSNAIEVLDLEEKDIGIPFDEIHLDHDLGFVFDEYNRTYDGEFNARHMHTIKPFVQHLVKNRKDRTTKIIVHSHNEPAAANMVLDLTDAGYQVTRRKFWG